METHYLVVNSNLRDTTLYPYANSYIMHLLNPIEDIVRVELIQAAVPNVIENVTDGTNIIQVSNLVNNTLHSFSIPNGFYSASGLASEIEYAINFETSVNVTYLNNEGKYLFTRSNTHPAFDLKPSATLATLMGFSDTSTRTAVEIQDEANTTPAFTLYANNERYRENFFIKSDRLVNLAADNFMFLDVPELNTVRMQQAQRLQANSFSTTAAQNSFGPIPLDVGAGGIKNFKETSDFIYGVDFDPPISALSRLTVRWRKSDGSLIDFQGLEQNSFIVKVFSKFRKDDVAPNTRMKAAIQRSKPRPIVLVPTQR
jgi:hypothetical protein